VIEAFDHDKVDFSLFNTFRFHMTWRAAKARVEANFDQGNDRGSAFLAFLQQNATIDATTIRRVQLASATTNQSIETIILELGLLEENRLADELSNFLGLERVNATQFPDAIAQHPGMPIEYLQLSRLLPLEITPTQITIAASCAVDDTAIRSLCYFLGLNPVVKIATASDIAKQLNGLLKQQNVDIEAAGADDTTELLSSDIDRLRDVASEAPIIKLFGRLVSSATQLQASDIHIEPMEDHVRIRYRIDGALQEVETVSKAMQLGLTSRIKILAKLNIAENRLPQDGRIRLPIKGKDIDFRVSTSPTTYGESVVLRILDQRHVALDFAELGFEKKAIEILKKAIEQPNGVVLVTGPTGSGKTTTLYSALQLLNVKSTKVFTVEDPIEYNMKGVNQILVRPQIGLDFANVLRSILRQDPDVIMVGEIRDAETAKIAIQASLTGHLVLSTLHTNSAASTITRLRDIGIDTFLLASTLRLVVAQRLVRKLCNACKKPICLSENSKTKPSLEYEAVGCGNCNNTGYKGRMVIYELLEVTEAMRAVITKDTTEDQIHALAVKEGLLTLYDCGLAKVRDGETSYKELLRVTGAHQI
jgi:general secretion pathway protein E